jgi:hypothetical protein
MENSRKKNPAGNISSVIMANEVNTNGMNSSVKTSVIMAFAVNIYQLSVQIPTEFVRLRRRQ